MPREYPIERVRDIGFIAHIDAGKTTTTERVLFYTGVSHKIGEVHDGQAIMDWMDQEKERGITITSAATTCYWVKTDEEHKKENEYQINIIDTPGHIDFTAEVQRALRVLDGAIVIFDGVEGVEAQSETVWHQADDFKVPRLCFINKLDRMGASFERSFESICQKLTKKAVAMQIPIGKEESFEGIIDLLKMKAYYFEGKYGENVVEKEIPSSLVDEAKKWREKLVEKIVEEDEKLMERYLEGKEISVDELKKVLRKATIEFRLVPVFCGSSLKNKGVQLLLDGIVDYLPSPKDLPPVEGVNPKTGEKEIRERKDDEPLCLLLFKTQIDPYVGELTYFRVYSGHLKKGDFLLNPRTGERVRIGRILRMHANQRTEIDEVFSGGLAATVGLKGCMTGDTLCDEKHPIVLERITFPEPVISLKIEPKTKKDEERLPVVLKKFATEDPTFKFEVNPETKDTIISGMGELHLDIIVDRMKREFGVNVNVGKPQVAYKETITTSAEAEGKYIRQSGGRGQYGHVIIKVEPKGRGEGFEFVDKIKGGIIPKEFIPSVEKGVREALKKGVLAGYPLVDLRVILFDGSFHEVDSSDFAFRTAGEIALKEGAKKANPTLLEPIMKLQVRCPKEYFGDVVGDLSSRRAKIESTEDRENIKIINAKVPLAEMFGYATTLRSLTQGRGNFVMEFSHYEEVPKHLQQEIIEGKRK